MKTSDKADIDGEKRCDWNGEKGESSEMQYNALRMMESDPENEGWVINSDFFQQQMSCRPVCGSSGAQVI